MQRPFDLQRYVSLLELKLKKRKSNDMTVIQVQKVILLWTDFIFLLFLQVSDDFIVFMIDLLLCFGW